MTPEEQQRLEDNAILDFLGSSYGELKKLDGNIVGSSSTLAPKSHDAKKVVEDFVKSKQRPTPPPPQPPPPPVEVQQPQVQAQQPVTPVQQVVSQPQIDQSQLSFNFEVNEKEELFSLIEKVLTRLDKLHRKVDDLSDSIKNNKVTSLPIKKTAKKKSVNKEET